MGCVEPDALQMWSCTYELTLTALREAARKALEELMTSANHGYQSDFARKYFSKGRDEGKDEGRAEDLPKPYSPKHRRLG